MIRAFFLSFLSLALVACASTAQSKAGSTEHPEASLYDAQADAKAEVGGALMAAEASGKRALIVMGANWCHDSRALAGWFETPRFQTLIAEHYELAYVDVGAKNRNIDIAKQFGLDSIVGTPTVFITSPKGEVLNLSSAPTWRNAASRSEDDIYRYFEDFAVK